MTRAEPPHHTTLLKGLALSPKATGEKPSQVAWGGAPYLGWNPEGTAHDRLAAGAGSPFPVWDYA
jgi:hypothetical protein